MSSPSPSPPTSSPLLIAQYAITGHPRRTEHWNITALLSKDEARIFELAGNYDSFAYVPSSSATPLSESSRVLDSRGGFLLCAIPAERLAWLEQALGSIEVVRRDPEYDCQTWVMLGVRLLQDAGLVPRAVTERQIREELEKEKERWEVADDTLVEKLVARLG